MTHVASTLLVAAALLAPTAAAGGVAVLVAAPGAGALHDVRVFDEATGAEIASPPLLQGIALLEIDVNGRTQLELFTAGQADLALDVPGAARVVLPGARGSLFRYRRPHPAGGADYGFFVVRPDGGASVVLERSGWGTAKAADPFVPRLALSPQGDALLVATVVAAGGDLLEAALADPPLVRDRTATLPPMRWWPRSLLLAPEWGVAATRRGIVRFDRAPGAIAAPLPFAGSPAPTYASGNIVLSRNGEWALATAGSGAASLHVWAFGRTGAAVRASETAAHVSGAGWAPDAVDGPHLAISDDGAQAAWRTEGVTREAFVAPVQVPLPPSAVEVSSDLNFADTLDEIGLFAFKTVAGLSLAVGSRVEPGISDIEHMDLFTVEMPVGGGMQITNQSLTSGDGTLPFLGIGAIKPILTTFLPDRSTTILFDESQQHGRILAVRDGQPGTLDVLGNVKDLDLLEVAGGWIALGIRRSDGNRPHELWRVPVDLALPAVRVVTTDGDQFGRHAPRRDGLLAYVTSEPQGEFLDRTHLASGATERFPGGPAVFGPALTMTSGGGVAFTTESAGAATFHVWPASGAAVVLQVAPGAAGQVLPGL